MHLHDPAPQASRLMFYGSSKLRGLGWEPLLHVWSTLLDYYDNPADSPREVVYWYGERALYGLLAAAAWKLPGGWSLQEVTWEAAHAQRGRTDLWLGFEHHQFTIEAKLCWLGTSDIRGGQWSKAVQAMLRQAYAQLRMLPPGYRVGSPVALAFLVPEWCRRVLEGLQRHTSRSSLR
jgi:hypothetical protein